MARSTTIGILLTILGLLAGAIGSGGGGAQPGGQVVAWVKYADRDQEWARLKQILIQEIGVRVEEIETEDPAELSAYLAEAQVLLIPEQEGAWEDTLEQVGASLGPALVEFLEKGGWIILFEHAAGGSDLLRGAGLTTANDDMALVDATLEVSASQDPLLRTPYAIPSQFEAPNATTDFTTVDGDAVVLIEALRTGKPVVFRLDRHGGRIVLFGFDYYEYNEATKHLVVNALVNALFGATAHSSAFSPLPRITALGESSSEVPPRVLEAAQSAVEVAARGRCAQSGDWGVYSASGVILKQDGSVLAPGHAFWCGGDPSDLFDPSTTAIAITRWRWELQEGEWVGELLETIRLTRADLAQCVPTNPALDTRRDLALIKLVDLQPPGGLKIDQGLAGQQVWILGYGDPGQLTPVQGTVTEVREDGVWIRVDTPAQPGMSGSAAVTEDGVVIGIVSRAGEGFVIATPALAARPLYDTSECP